MFIFLGKNTKIVTLTFAVLLISFIPPVMHSSCPAPHLSCMHSSCHVSLLSCIPHVLTPTCHAFLLSYITPSWILHAMHPSCHAFLMSCTSPVVHSSCHESLMGCIPYVLHPTCHAFLMFCPYHGVHSSCYSSLLSCIPHVVHPTCCPFLMSPSHSTVLASPSTVAWITGERQFSRWEWYLIFDNTVKLRYWIDSISKKKCKRSKM